MSPSTEAGRRLLEREAFNSRSFAIVTPDAIAAIEAEARTQGALHESLASEGDIERARAALLAELEAGVEGLPGIECWPEDGFEGRLVHRAAVLDLIRKAGKA